jgi:tetratricopeptide (TPR) repeat protein
MNKIVKKGWGWALGLLLLTGSLPALSAPYIQKADGTKIFGDTLLVRINGDAILSKEGVRQTFPKGSYVIAVGDKPAAYDRARQLAAAKKYDEAIQLLEDVIKSMFGQQWDLRAMADKGRVELDAGRPEAAVTTFEKLFGKAPGRLSGDPLSNYAQALIQTKAYSKHERLARDAIKSTKREDNALGHILIGDMKADQNDPDSAVLEYLMTALLFTKEARYAAEANYKAGTTLKKMRDKRAQARFEAAIKLAPDSEWAQKAKQEI